jgi:hypothetical protein
LTRNARAASLTLVIHPPDEQRIPLSIASYRHGLLSPDRSTCSGAAPVSSLVRSPERALGHALEHGCYACTGARDLHVAPTRRHELTKKGGSCTE